LYLLFDRNRRIERVQDNRVLRLVVEGGLAEGKFDQLAGPIPVVRAVGRAQRPVVGRIQAQLLTALEFKIGAVEFADPDTHNALAARAVAPIVSLDEVRT